ncbi:Ubiquitin system component Cue [Penicillium capsulatum]|uniref:Ubiquitin system component Cue n=1 Tax=Penicillium capsulatum TaxID=69766 RepID=A0A9W9I2V4_9EURO|nr:Ubiquitin system component Cue [Penicillium capsulatum]
MVEFPPLAPVPPPAVRKTIPSNDWEACLDAWMTLLGIRLNATDETFKAAGTEDLPVGVFLESFYQYAAAGDPGLQNEPNARKLRKLCFLTTRRYLLSLSNPPEELLSWHLLGNISSCYPSSSALKSTLSTAWDTHNARISSSLEKAKSIVIQELSSVTPSSIPNIISDIRRLTILASMLPPCGQVLMAGSDYLDTLAETYQSQKAPEELKRILVANVYVGLVSL